MRFVKVLIMQNCDVSLTQSCGVTVTYLSIDYGYRLTIHSYNYGGLTQSGPVAVLWCKNKYVYMYLAIQSI